jgi:hypothetical protein
MGTVGLGDVLVRWEVSVGITSMASIAPLLTERRCMI